MIQKGARGRGICKFYLDEVAARALKGPDDVSVDAERLFSQLLEEAE